MKKIAMWVACVLMFTFVFAAVGEGLFRPKTAGDNLGTSTYPFGTIYAAGQALSSGVWSFVSTDMKQTNSIATNGNMTLMGTLDVKGSVTVKGGASYTGTFTNQGGGVGVAGSSNVFVVTNGIILSVTTIP